MRLFIAINFDEGTKQKLLAVQNRLRERAARGSFSRPGNLHLTLAFLGEVEAERVAAVRQAVEHTRVEPMTLIFDHTGCFQRNGGDIWWIGIQENRSLLRLHGELTEQLTVRGFRLENRKFTPHLTLAREILLRRPTGIGDLLEEPFSAEADKISLMLSERADGLLHYTELFSR